MQHLILPIPLPAILFLVALGCGRPSTAAAPAPPPEPSASAAPEVRIAAVGDLHADLPQALAALALAGVVDADGHWSGGTATLVQTGDLTDRGPDSMEVMDLMRRLGTEAEAAGGRVVQLLGNHETMNLRGDWRYVSEGDVADFGSVEARKAAFAPDGTYGAWLRSLPVTAVVGDAVFVHGGILPPVAALGIDGINEAVHASLAASDAPPLGTDGPLWARSLVEEPEAQACSALARSLEALGARRMVVGHTTRRTGRIETRCGGRLAVIDTGISSHYGGHLSAWEWRDGDARALYPTGPSDLPDPPP